MEFFELLARVSEIRMKHDLVADLTGENFNIFNILGMRTHETRTHSAFLGELLNPNGSHGMGATFLKMFVGMLREKYPSNTNGLGKWDGEPDVLAKVELELWISRISEDGSQGGRIDIAIIPSRDLGRILIENKIAAVDQKLQLLRYHNHDPNAHLVYLTLYGAAASNVSTENTVTKQAITKDDYLRLSYSEDIVNWLEECAKQSTNRPLVRETIVQYIYLIRDLTNQNSNSQMTQEINRTVLSNKQSLRAFFSLEASGNSIRETIFKSIKDEIQTLAGSLDLICEIDLSSGVVFKDHGILCRNNLSMCFAREDRWFYGLIKTNQEDISPGNEILEEITLRLRNESNFKTGLPSPLWPIWSWWNGQENWNSDNEALVANYFDRDAEGRSPIVHEMKRILTEMKNAAYGVLQAAESSCSPHVIATDFPNDLPDS